MGSIANVIAHGVKPIDFGVKSADELAFEKARATTQEQVGEEARLKNVRTRQDMLDDQRMSDALVAAHKEAQNPQQVPDLALRKFIAAGGTAPRAQALVKFYDEHEKNILAAKAEDLKLKSAEHDQMEGLIGAVVDEKDPEIQSAKYRALLASPMLPGQVRQQLPPQWDPRIVQGLAAQRALLIGGKAAFDRAIKEQERKTAERQAAAAELQAQTHQTEIEAKLPGERAKSEQEQRQLDAQALAAAARQGQEKLDAAIGEMPVKRAKPFLGLKTPDEILRVAVPPEKQVPPITAAPEQQYINEYRARHPGATVEDAIRAYTQIQGAPARAEAHERASMARTDRSYQFHARELDTVSKPIDDLSARLSRMQETLAQGNPTADALLAPELMTIVAGGQGSGVRLTQAEINSVVGGRSVWEGLRAAAQKWSTDPNSASTITPDQRERIRALATAVDRKVKAKQAALANARADLANSDNVADHRAIVNKARQQVTQIEQEAPNTTPQGQIRVKRKSDGKTGTMPAANFDASKYDKLP